MPRKIIYNARVVTETETISDGFVELSDGLIVKVGKGRPEDVSGADMTDAGGGYLMPGFIDLHCHGGGGSDFMDGGASDILTAARAHLKHGTTCVAPTTLTCSDGELFQFFDSYKEAKKTKTDMPRLAGIHLEGPYFSPEQAGAQPPEYLRAPERRHYEEILRRAEGDIIRWSLAPELPGALRLGDELKERGILASVGHSDADYEVMKAAVRHGFTHVTHLYSGMSSLRRVKGHRKLGVVECAYLFDELDVEIISDGLHLPPELLRLVVKQKPLWQIALVSDAMRGAGMPDGPSILGSRANGHEVVIRDGVAYMPDFSGFAGSVATADRLVRTMVHEAGLPLHIACRMMSLNPARFIGKEDILGSIAPGKQADLVLADERLEVNRVYVEGKEINIH